MKESSKKVIATVSTTYQGNVPEKVAVLFQTIIMCFVNRKDEGKLPIKGNVPEEVAVLFQTIIM